MLYYNKDAYHIKSYIILYYIISSYIIWYYVVWYHVIIYDLIGHDIAHVYIYMHVYICIYICIHEYNPVTTCRMHGFFKSVNLFQSRPAMQGSILTNTHDYCMRVNHVNMWV